MTLQEAVKIYTICARAENKSERTIEWVEGAARRLQAFTGCKVLDICFISADLIRWFIISLDPWSGWWGTPPGKLKPWLGWVLWGIIGGASLGATLGYLKKDESKH